MKKKRIVKLEPQTVELFAEVLSKLRPPPPLTVSQWADRYRVLSAESSAEPIFIDSELVEILQKIRNHFGKPVNITSGFRTASKNATIKNAAKFSQHLYGKAADIWISGVTVEQIAAYAETLLPNRGGIGRYPKEGHANRTHGWVHIDTRAAKSRWVS